MSQQLINRSPDLKRLRDEGFNISIEAGYVVMRDIPYVGEGGVVRQGTLVDTLNSNGQKTVPPKGHVIFFDGEYPCTWDGCQIEGLRNNSNAKTLVKGLDIKHEFSARPTESFPDYYSKFTNYVNIIAPHAKRLEYGVDARTFPPVLPDDDEPSIFKYIDTASSRANIVAINEKLRTNKVAIVGLGGTGSYVLDFIAKAPIVEIHLFDEDRFLSHNAFRAPGAPSLETLQRQPTKVAYLTEVYSPMRNGVIPHETFITEENVAELDQMDFVFLCMEGEAKEVIIDRLVEAAKPFIDVGMGLDEIDGHIDGILRITTSTAERREHVKKRIPLGNPVAGREYDQNIQVADMNALNAALAVAKWKKLCGFYADLEGEFSSTYTVDGNKITNEDRHV
jgi:ThiF family